MSGSCTCLPQICLERTEAAVQGMQGSQDLQPEKVRAADAAAVPFPMRLLGKEGAGVFRDGTEPSRTLGVFQDAHRCLAQLLNSDQRASVRPTSRVVNDEFE